MPKADIRSLENSGPRHKEVLHKEVLSRRGGGTSHITVLRVYLDGQTKRAAQEGVHEISRDD